MIAEILSCFHMLKNTDRIRIALINATDILMNGTTEAVA